MSTNEMHTLGEGSSVQSGMIQFESDNSLLLIMDVPVPSSFSVIRKSHFCIY